MSLDKTLLKEISILYVEDDKSTSQLMYSSLSLLSNNIHLASNGIEALALYHTSNPQLIISDIEYLSFSYFSILVIKFIASIEIPYHNLSGKEY